MVRKEPYDELKLKYNSLFHNDWNDVYAEDVLLVISTKQPDELLQISAYLILRHSLFWLSLINAIDTFSLSYEMNIHL